MRVRIRTTVIVGSMACVTLSGNTCVYRNVKEMPDGDEETRDCGAVLEVTPTVSEDGKLVDLDLRPQLTRFAGYVHENDTRKAVYASITAETKVALSAGSTLMLAGGVPAVETLGPVGEEYPAGMASGHDGRPVLIFVTVSLLR